MVIGGRDGGDGGCCSGDGGVGGVCYGGHEGREWAVESASGRVCWGGERGVGGMAGSVKSGLQRTFS